MLTRVMVKELIEAADDWWAMRDKLKAAYSTGASHIPEYEIFEQRSREAVTDALWRVLDALEPKTDA